MQRTRRSRLRRPTQEDLLRLDERLGFGLAGSELEELTALVADAMATYDWLEDVADAVPAVDGRPRPPGHRPDEQENPLGAWYWRTDLRGRSDGPLRGRSLVVKDNVCVAGVPMMNGSAVLEGYVPEVDATVVARALDAGATVVGKAVCESFCYSGGSHTSDTGPVRNPYDPTRSSGGSSSGCAALVAAEEADLAIGGDQGGSIRGPSSWCGIFGLKPTYGLVPYTGAFPVEMTLDHLGHMARSARDVALLIDAIAGPDGDDPRQLHAPPRADKAGYRERLEGDVVDVRIGILEEGFAWEGASEDDVDAAVRTAAHALHELGARVSPISVPWHRDGGKLWCGVAFEGVTRLLMHGNGVGSSWKGRYLPSMMEATGAGRRMRGDRFPVTVKFQALMGEWMHETYHGRFYAMAQNLGRCLSAAYDRAFEVADILVLPTLPMKATPLPANDATTADRVARAIEMAPNTAPFNVTGHPALNVPCAVSDQLPVGMMLVGRRGEDGLLLRVADAFERNVFRMGVPAGGTRGARTPDASAMHPTI